MDIFQTIIVTEEEAPAARAKAAETPGGEGMFTTPLSPTGLSPVTHYISSGYVPEVIADSLIALNTTSEDPLTAMDITDEGPFTAMERLGLKIISDVPVAEQTKGLRRNETRT
jgi:hypothetical protein